jgi:AAA+ ATPase superfamily predicted ATPase
MHLYVLRVKIIMKTFIGRQAELKKLRELQLSFRQKGLASLVVIKGRRCIGKSRLAEEFAKGQRFLSNYRYR